MNIINLEITKIITFIALILYLTCIIAIAIKDKKYRRIEKKVLAYGIIISIIYIIYSCIVEKDLIIKYMINLIAMIVLLTIDNICLRKKAESNYIINILMLIMLMIIFTGKCVTILTLTGGMIAIALNVIMMAIKNRKRSKTKKYYKNTGIGFILVTMNIMVLVLSLIYNQIYLT